MHKATTDELVHGLTIIDGIFGVSVVFRADHVKYIHNYIGAHENAKQLVKLVTKGGVTGEIMHILTTEKGMEPVAINCDGCPTGMVESYWTLPKESALFEQAREGFV